MINTLSMRMAQSLGDKLQSNEDQIAIYTYGLEIILGIIIKITCIVSLAILFGIIKTAMIFLLTFPVFRYIGGGVHLSTYFKCLLFGVSLTLLMGYASTLTMSEYFLYTLFSFSLILMIYVTIRWVPAGTEKKIISNKEARLKQKKKALVASIIWSIIEMFFLTHGLHSYAFAGILGLLCSSFFILPWGYQLIDTLDNIIIINKGGAENV